MGIDFGQKTRQKKLKKGVEEGITCDRQASQPGEVLIPIKTFRRLQKPALNSGLLACTH